jgi:hypothetical protein
LRTFWGVLERGTGRHTAMLAWVSAIAAHAGRDAQDWYSTSLPKPTMPQDVMARAPYRCAVGLMIKTDEVSEQLWWGRFCPRRSIPRRVASAVSCILRIMWLVWRWIRHAITPSLRASSTVRTAIPGIRVQSQGGPFQHRFRFMPPSSRRPWNSAATSLLHLLGAQFQVSGA